jgi:uncharacterized protein YbjT (DUF2867 family)
MRIVVGLATGKTGTAVVHALSKTGNEIVAITRDPSSEAAKKLAKLPNVTVATQEDALKIPVDRAYLACHNFRGQVVDETAFIIALRQAGVKYIVKLATFGKIMSVYSNVYYGRTHLAVEKFLEDGDVPFTSLRPNLFFETLGGDYSAVVKTKSIGTTLQDADVAMIDSRDVGDAAAALLVLEDPSPHYGKKYDLNGPEDVNRSKVAQVFRQVLQEDIKVVAVTEEELRQGLRNLGYDKLDLDSMVQTSTKYLTKGQNSKAQTLTSKEILDLVPLNRTFLEFVTELYAKNK